MYNLQTFFIEQSGQDHIKIIRHWHYEKKKFDTNFDFFLFLAHVSDIASSLSDLEEDELEKNSA